MQPAVPLVAIYLRLSKEEAKTLGESQSIANQRKICEQFCKDNDITIVAEFVDDGYTGSNFIRPDFQKMLMSIDSGLINTVITKDLSRLGRDLQESSYYAEKYFPNHNVHYIAILDHFDSECENPMAPFQFAMNDMYIRDCSRKIKAVIYQKRKNGEYCACPPFGYMRNPNDSTSIIPDPKTAPIVQYIFTLAANGKSAHQIANQLTEEGYITPLKYRVLYRDNFCEKGAARATDKWNHTTVKRILQNQVYLGHTVLGKTKKVSLKAEKKKIIPESEWCITPNTHQPLVSQEQFDMAKYHMGIHTKKCNQYDHVRKSIFNGIIFCENCGSALCSSGSVYKGERKKYWYLSCQNIPKRSKKHCDHGARVRYSDLVEIVKSELNSFIDLSKENIDSIINEAISKSTTKIYQDSEDSIESINKRLSEIERIIFKLYNDNSNGLITDEQLSNILKSFSKESESLKERAAKLSSKGVESNNNADSYKAFFSLIQKYNHIDELTPEIVRTFIERIEIGEKILPDGYTVASHNIPFKQNIKITYRFIGNISETTRSFNGNKKKNFEPAV